MQYVIIGQCPKLRNQCLGCKEGLAASAGMRPDALGAAEPFGEGGSGSARVSGRFRV